MNSISDIISHQVPQVDIARLEPEVVRNLQSSAEETEEQEINNESKEGLGDITMKGKDHMIFSNYLLNPPVALKHLINILIEINQNIL